jgi:hypothetical protein
MMKVHLGWGLLLCCCFVACGQETAGTCNTSSIYGQVISADSSVSMRQPWIVQVTAKRFGNNSVLDSEESQGEWFCVKVPLFSKAVVFFERNGFDPQNTDEIDTNKSSKRHSFALPVIKLDPIVANVRSSDFQTPQDLPQKIRARLNQHKDAVTATGSNDIFTWNLELYRNLYSNRPEVLREIDTFEEELKQQPQFLFLSTSEFEQKSKLFRYMIARSRNQSVERDVKIPDITALVNDSRMLSSIRLEAITLLDSLHDELTALERRQAAVALTAALERDPSANMRMQSAKALTQMADEHVLDALRNASTTDESAEVRTFAYAALMAITTRPAIYSPMPTTKTVQNPDGTYAIVEYPAKKEITVKLNPTNIRGANGIATILRDDDGTRITLNLTNVPTDISELTLYAVDDTGAVTALGPVAITNGVGTLATTTPLTKFMLIGSPESALTAYDANTRVFFKSAVPEGLAVIPMRANPSGERVAAVGPFPTGTQVSAAHTYTVPLLGIHKFKRGDDTRIRVDFTGPLSGTRANVFVTPHKGGPTEVRMRFHELKEAPAGESFIVWAVGADGQYQKLGQIVNTGGKDVEFTSETALQDFGLLITQEGKVGESPLGPAIATIHIVP